MDDLERMRGSWLHLTFRWEGETVTYLGHVENGVVVLDIPKKLPDGVWVRVEVQEGSDEKAPLGKGLLRFSGVVKDLPEDMAMNHDHYLSSMTASRTRFRLEEV